MTTKYDKLPLRTRFNLHPDEDQSALVHELRLRASPLPVDDAQALADLLEAFQLQRDWLIAQNNELKL